MARGSPYQPERVNPKTVEETRRWLQQELDKISNALGIINERKVMSGNGSPASAVAAPPGSLYVDLAGGAGTTLYVKESAYDDTGWVAK